MVKVTGVIVTNRRAFRDYFVVESYEAGIELKGSEVKSLRESRGNLNNSFAKIIHDEIYLFNMHISPYEYCTVDVPDPLRDRKLLLHKSEIRKISGKLSSGKYTLIPLKLYFKKGYVKVELALAAGKASFDKREAIKEREHNLKIRRAVRRRV